MASGFDRGALIIDDAAQSRINLGLQIGVDVQAWSDELDGLSLLNTTGFVVRTANGTYAIREFIEGSGITITNPDGVSGNPIFASFGGSGNVNVGYWPLIEDVRDLSGNGNNVTLTGGSYSVDGPPVTSFK